MFSYILKISSFCLLVLFCTTPVYADSEIKPFGDIEWSDGFQDVVFKINQNSEIEEVSFNVIAVGKCNLKGVGNLDALNGRLRSVFAARDNSFYQAYCGGFFDFYGNRTCTFYSNEGNCLYVYPINIEGLAFRMNVKFSSAFGYNMLEFNKIASANCGTFNVIFPLVVTSVELWCSSSVTNAQVQRIYGLLESKYGSYPGGGKIRTGSTTIIGDNGTSLYMFNDNNTHFQIRYKITDNNKYIKDYRDAYDNNSNRLMQEKMKYKKNMSNGL